MKPHKKTGRVRTRTTSSFCSGAQAKLELKQDILKHDNPDLS